MTVKYSTLETGKGFTSPGFNVNDTGTLVLTSIDVQEIKLGGQVLFTAGDGGEEENPGPVTGLSSTIINSNLETLGTLSSLTVVGTSSLTGGTVTITSSTTGNINNLNIGTTSRGTGAFTTLAANSTTTLSGDVDITGTGTVTINPTGSVTINPTSVGNIDNMNIGSTTPGTGVFDSIQLTQEAVATNEVPTRGYVDKRATALSIALGT